MISNGLSPSPTTPCSQKSDVQVPQSRSGEWTEINLNVSSPEEDVPYSRLENGENGRTEEKPKLVRQKTLPNPRIEHEYSALKGKAKLDSTISSWISRSSAKTEDNESGNGSKYTIVIYCAQ